MDTGRYKLRAECMEDITTFINAAWGHISNIKIIPDSLGLPDTEMEFNSVLKKNEIIEVLDILDDLHVMAETVELIGDYRGTR